QSPALRHSICTPLFFNDPCTTDIYTLSLHDALPICDVVGSTRIPASCRSIGHGGGGSSSGLVPRRPGSSYVTGQALAVDGERLRSEEHTSELQSRENLVCRLLLEKKKTTCDNHRLSS